MDGEKLEVGDVVELVGGSPRMTIDFMISENIAFCVWFNVGAITPTNEPIWGDRHGERFSSGSLRRIHKK